MAGVPEAEPVRLRLSREAFAGRTVGTFCLVDVRTPAEFRAIHAEGAALVPLNCLDAKSLGSQSRGPVYLICASGARARLAAETLDAAGVPQPTMIQGGTSAWEAGGLPVVRGKNLISLERQVRIAAGSPVLTDTLLGWFVNR
jgi:rhodanese-related sulfurtransferase